MKAFLKSSCIFTAGALLMCSLWVSPASAFTFDDIDYWVGEGSNQAALVIDWHDERSEALVWGYRWDGTATGEDMLAAIAGTSVVGSSNGASDLGTISGSDSRLYVNFTAWSGFDGNYTVFGLGYDLDSDGFSYVAGANETGHAADADDVYLEGWYNGFWSYWVEDDGDDVLGNGAGMSGLGLSARTLADGSVDLWAGCRFRFF